MKDLSFDEQHLRYEQVRNTDTIRSGAMLPEV